MRRIIYVCVCIFSIMACHKVDDTPLTQQRHVCTLKLELSVETYDLSTRSSRDNLVWESGTKLFLNFSNNGVPITGVADYDATDDSWTLSYTGNLNIADKESVSVYYFTNYEVKDLQEEITLTPESAIYSDTDATYSFMEDGELRVLAHLTPAIGRIRFKGRAGINVEIGGISYSDNFNLLSEKFICNQDPIVADVKSDGFTPYIYGKLNDTPKLLKIINAEYSFIRECSESVLEKGKSGWMNIPDNQNHEEWTFFDMPSLKELSSTPQSLLLEISSPMHWEIEVVNSSSWIVIDEKHGFGNRTVRVEILDNASMNARSDIVRVTSELGLTTEFCIHQSGRIFEMNIDKLDVDYTAQESDVIVVDSDGLFNVTATAAWINILDSTENSFRIHFDQNELQQDREGKVVVSLNLDNGEYASKEITISQASFGHGYVALHKYVDLGLPSSTKWSVVNVGSSSEEQLGDIYAWGETSTKSSYTTDNYSLPLYYGPLKGSYDVACVKWGQKWQIPTMDQLIELKENCTWTATKRNGYPVLEGEGPNGAIICIPYQSGSGVLTPYWSNEIKYIYNTLGGNMQFAKAAYILYNRLQADEDTGSRRSLGAWVRPVVSN